MATLAQKNSKSDDFEKKKKKSETSNHVNNNIWVPNRPKAESTCTQYLQAFYFFRKENTCKYYTNMIFEKVPCINLPNYSKIPFQ